MKVLANHGEGTGGCAKSSAEGSANSRRKQRSDLRKSKSKMFKAQASWSGLKWSKFPIASLSLSSHLTWGNLARGGRGQSSPFPITSAGTCPEMRNFRELGAVLGSS